MLEHDFEIVVPVYQITTPQTKYNFEVKSMTLGIEEKYKTSHIDPDSSYQKLSLMSSVIYDCIVSKISGVTDTYQNFIKNVQYQDVTSLLIAILHSTYGDEREYVATCPHCGKEIKINAPFSAGFKSQEQTENMLKQKPIEVSLPLSKMSVFLSCPSIDKTLMILKKFKNASDRVNLLLSYIDHIKYVPKDGTNKKTISDIDDIFSLLNRLPSNDVMEQVNKINENFDKYNSSLEYNTDCPLCGKTSIFKVSEVNEFLEMVS